MPNNYNTEISEFLLEKHKNNLEQEIQLLEDVIGDSDTEQAYKEVTKLKKQNIEKEIAKIEVKIKQIEGELQKIATQEKGDISNHKNKKIGELKNSEVKRYEKEISEKEQELKKSSYEAQTKELQDKETEYETLLQSKKVEIKTQKEKSIKKSEEALSSIIGLPGGDVNEKLNKLNKRNGKKNQMRMF